MARAVSSCGSLASTRLTSAAAFGLLARYATSVAPFRAGTDSGSTASARSNAARLSGNWSSRSSAMPRIVRSRTSRGCAARRASTIRSTSPNRCAEMASASSSPWSPASIVQRSVAATKSCIVGQFAREAEA